MRYRIKHINLESLNSNPSLAKIIIRLMMACNDISISNVCLQKYKENINRKTADISLSACMYFVKLQIGHLEEGLKIIRDIRLNSYCYKLIDKLSQKAQALFNALFLCANGSDINWKKNFTPIRGNLSFHYNHEKGSKLILKALSELITIKDKKTSRIVIGDINKMRFELGDEINDSIICRKFFNIPYSVDFEKDRTKLEEILSYGSSKCEAFLLFSSEFIYKNT